MFTINSIFFQKLIEWIYHLDKSFKKVKTIEDENDQLKSEAAILHNDSLEKSQEIKKLKLKVVVFLPILYLYQK